VESSIAKFGLGKYGVALYGSTSKFAFADPCLIGMEIRKRIGPMSTAILRPGIYQMRMTKRGKIPFRMKFYRPYNPQSPAQTAQREKWYAAVEAWSALTPEEKAVYNVEGRKLLKRGYDYFRSLHMNGLI